MRSPDLDPTADETGRTPRENVGSLSWDGCWNRRMGSLRGGVLRAPVRVRRTLVIITHQMPVHTDLVHLVECFRQRFAEQCTRGALKHMHQTCVFLSRMQANLQNTATHLYDAAFRELLASGFLTGAANVLVHFSKCWTHWSVTTRLRRSAGSSGVGCKYSFERHCASVSIEACFPKTVK